MEACFLSSTGKDSSLPRTGSVWGHRLETKVRKETRHARIRAGNDSKMPRVKRWDSTRAAQALAPGTGGKGRRFLSCSPPSQLRSGASECGEDSDGGGDVGSGKHANGTRAFPCLASWVRPEPPPCDDWQAASQGSRGLWERVRTLARVQVFLRFGTLGLIAGGWGGLCPPRVPRALVASIRSPPRAAGL